MKTISIWLVYLESNVDGEIYFEAIPCASLKIARATLKESKKFALTKTKHFSGYTKEELEEEFEIEETLNRFYINDPSDDYYEDYKIVKKEINNDLNF